MAEDYTIGIGTVGSGLHVSSDGGGRWRHIGKHLNPEGNVRAVAVFPDDPHHIIAASDRTGVFESRDNGYLWEPISPTATTSPFTDGEIWSVAVDPNDTDRIYVGARPAAFRSTDGGRTWEQMDTGISDECPIGTPRITCLVVDPGERGTVWAGVEVDGIHRSDDGGDTWEALDPIGPTAFHGDIHGLAVRNGGTPTVVATTPFGMATSTDDGATWEWRELAGFGDVGSRNEYAYCRGVFTKPDDADTMLVGCGDYIPGQIGGIETSHDGGRTWVRAATDAVPNSTVYSMAMHPSIGNVVVAVTVFGEVFVSHDSGDSFTKLDREFGEIRAVWLSPN